jgi:hypothetical protein
MMRSRCLSLYVIGRSVWALLVGRTPSLTPQQQAEARQRRAEGATLKDLARSYNVSMATISRLRT